MKTKQKKKKTEDKYADVPSAIGCFFLDSGAHSLYTREVIKKKLSKAPVKKRFAFYRTAEFRQYLDEYAAFVKANLVGIDYYANVDTIFEPELSWQTLKYLEEEHGLSPVPVIHYGTDLKWIERHLEAGYEYIGLGGLGQEVTAAEYKGWADSVYAMLCPKSNDYKPLVRTHGFAMTSYQLMMRYPWWSVDSASWIKAAAFGTIYFPHRRRKKGKHEWVFSEKTVPYTLDVSEASPSRAKAGKHIETMPKGGEIRKVLEAWLEEINVPLGKAKKVTDEKGKVKYEVVEYGVLSHHKARAQANLFFFERMAASLPEWPWPFEVKPKASFGIARSTRR